MRVTKHYMESLFAWTYDRSEAMDPLLFARIASKEKLQLPVFLRGCGWTGYVKQNVLDDGGPSLYLKIRIMWQIYTRWSAYLESPR